MAELVDAQVLGTCALVAWRFKSSFVHQGDWRSDSAAPLHGDGRGFESLIPHGLNYIMENIAFSDSIELSGASAVIAEATDFSETPLLSLDDYCKRHPDALECREYDV